MTKPMVTAISSKSDFMFRNASGYKASNTLCLASASTWLYFDTYMKPFADDPITVCTVKAGMQEKSSFRMPEASESQDVSSSDCTVPRNVGALGDQWNRHQGLHVASLRRQCHRWAFSVLRNTCMCVVCLSVLHLSQK